MTPKPSQSWPPALLLAVILLMSLATTTEQQPTPRITLPGCPDKCGNISIPYPFGTKDGCFLPGFNVTCNDTFYPPRPFLAGGVRKQAIHGCYPTDTAFQADEPTSEYPTQSPVEFIGVSIGEGEARVYGALSSLCAVNQTYRSFLRQVLWVPSPFDISRRNVLTGIGLNADCRLTRSTAGSDGAGIISCVSRPDSGAIAKDGACLGQGCCEAASTKALQDQIVVVADRVSYATPWRLSNNCSFGMLVEKDWYNYTSEDVYGDEAYFAERFPRGVPLVLDFAIGDGSCPAEGQPRPKGYACLSGNSSCINATDVPGYRCRCRDGYEGNPYVPTGCQDINECMDKNNCMGDHQTCINTLGSYYCACKRGTRPDGQTCTEIFPLPAKVVVGAIGGILITTVLIFILLLRKEKRKMRDFYERNGGLTLERAKTIKIFRKEELKPFLKKKNFIGKGNFGEVYWGLLGENQLVAVKKPIKVNVAENEQFANEVIIQSQVIHKNIVKLIGCCLEVDIPMLVYEFVSKGSLDDILHGSTRAPLNLGVRLNIAAESAEGLAYMHSGTTTTVLHGDVKPANILLNENYVPKISDFGISKLINKDIAQHANYVIGDMSYMDPVYQQTGLLTDKSDVYSFGLVLLELISRKKATNSDNNSLVRNFVDAYTKEKRSTELFDMEIAVVASDMELLDCLAGIAVECLNLDVDQRPEMTDIAERLLVLKRARNK